MSQDLNLMYTIYKPESLMLYQPIWYYCAAAEKDVCTSVSALWLYMSRES
jgi:hypothetical protein